MARGFEPSVQPIVIFAGAFGSGKTEVAINYCRRALSCGKAVRLVDLDVVTPYFRVGDYRSALQQEGIHVIAAPGSLASFELPALSPEIAAALRSEETQAVLDAGGDPVGARLLAAYADQIRRRGYDLWLVVNPYRPATASASEIQAHAQDTEASCGLRLTAIVANPHVGSLTKWSEVRRGLQIVAEAASALNLPIAFLAIERSRVPGGGAGDVPILPMTLIVRPPWDVRAREERLPARRSEPHA